jgi:hypothetical protein
VKTSLEHFFLYENALNNAIRCEYENGPRSETTRQAWARTRELRLELVLTLKKEE